MVGADQQEADRRARSARHPPAGDRRARRPPDPRLGDLRARHHRRALRPRRRERRGGGVRRGRRAFAQAVSADAAAAVHLRIHLFLAARIRSSAAAPSTTCARPWARELAREAPAAADVVVPVPDSGVPAAIGYAQASGIPYELGIIRNHYVGRTFIEPTQQIRAARRAAEAQRQPRGGQRQAHRAGRRLDRARHDLDQDRADDARRRRDAKCTSASPRRRSRIRTITASTRRSRTSCSPPPTIEDMRHFIGADSLAFLSVDGLYRAMGHERRDPDRPQFTDHCFTGDYPTAAHRPHARAAVAARRAAASVAARRGELRRFAAVEHAGRLSTCPSLAGRIALVTGASRGIGHATALALAKAGAHVVAIARTVGGLEELDDAIKAAGGSATLVPLDLKDYDGIDRLGASLNERYRQARRAGRQCRHARRALADQPCRAESVRRRDGGQRHRQLAADPLARSAAAEIRCRARGVRHLRRRVECRWPIGGPTRSRRPRSN